LRKTVIEAPIALAPFFIVPPQPNEEKFLKTVESFGFKPAMIRHGLFQHMERTTGYNLTQRPLVIMETTKDEFKLQKDFHDRFVQQILPLLRVFDRLFPVEGLSPTVELMTGQLSEHVFSSVVLNLQEGEMRRQGLGRMGGELSTGLRLSPDRVKEFEKQGFDKILNWVRSSRGSLSKRTRNALTFFNRARDAEIQRENLSAFIFSMIALESLFSRDPGVPLRATLADSVALLTESKVDERLTSSKRVKKLYDRRSEIVHSGTDFVESDDLRDSMRFCSRSLLEVLKHATIWGDVVDANLFEEIDRRKFN